MKESKFQAGLIKEIKDMLVDVVVLKNDSSYQQGIPDLLILHPNGWAVLEVKKSLNEPYQPNQEYYIDLLNGWSFAAMICPENKEDILDELYTALVRR
ncbi:endonuclease [Arthrobacter phage Qui]|uniref:Hydrolase n=1 Tax=Arthrobacter phage Qui TaxID=2603260 RepID=A0A5B8WM86_9CAUD|nr:endonuclease [Arthrobacter phage Qui]QED11732.1 VRR-Nuc domain protein [Arthrobacter phage Qui]QOC56564.1 VRR-Nuc domain protein [Arthrobacter phage Paella]